MRILLATAAFVSLLIAGGRANATAAGSPNPALGRCIEQPMSLAIAIAEAEAGRTVTPRSLVSPSEPIVASPRTPPPAEGIAAPVAPVTPSPMRLCSSPDDPRCHVSSLPSLPLRIQLDRIDHGCTVAPEPVLPAAAQLVSIRGLPEAEGRALEAYSAGPWRPPAR